MEQKSVVDLTDKELIRELLYCNKMKKFYYTRYDEIVKEIERRDEQNVKV